MKPALPFRYQSSTVDRPIFVAFLSSRRASASEVVSIDSQSDEFLRSLNRPIRTVTVLFENQNGQLIIRERVNDGTRPHHGATGNLVIPLGNFGKPACQNQKGNVLIVTLPLCQRFTLGYEHYRADPEGDWNSGSCNRLLSFNLRKHAAQVRVIHITFFNASQNAWLKPDYILGLFEQYRDGPDQSTQIPSGQHSVASREITQDAQKRLEEALNISKSAQKRAEKAQSAMVDSQKNVGATQGKLKEAQAEISSLFQHLSTAQEKHRETQEKLQVSKDTINLLRHQLKDVSERYAASQDQFKSLQKAIDISNQQASSRAIPAEFIKSTTDLNGSLAGRSHSLQLTLTDSNEQIRNILSADDQGRLIKVTRVRSHLGKYHYKLDFGNLETAIEVLERTKTSIREKYAYRISQPTIDYFSVDIAGVSEQPATSANATSSTTAMEKSDASEKIVRENLSLRSHVQSLQSEVEALKTQSKWRKDRIETLLEDIKNLKQQVDLATKPARASTMEQDSVNLLDLDLEFDACEESTLIPDAKTQDQSQPSWLDLYFPSSSDASADNEGRDHLEIAPQVNQEAGMSSKASSGHSHASHDPDMLLAIDDAVDAVGEVQKEALKAGKAVTVEIKEVEEMPNWLAQVNRRIVIDSTGAIRAAP